MNEKLNIFFLFCFVFGSNPEVLNDHCWQCEQKYILEHFLYYALTVVILLQNRRRQVKDAYIKTKATTKL